MFKKQLFYKRPKPCTGCGSIISNHHTPTCSYSKLRGIRDLVPVKGTSWWIYANKRDQAEKFLADLNNDSIVERSQS